MKFHFNRFDYGSFSTFAAYSFSSLVIPIVLIPLAASLNFPLEDGGKGLGGALQLGRAIPMVIGMIFCGVIAGRFGKARSLGFSVLLMGLGIMLCAFAPSYSVIMLLIAAAGLGEGVIEGIATPFIQDQHSDEPGRYINFTHAFWSVGVVAVTITAGLALDMGVSWRTVVFCAGLVSLIPAILMLMPDRKNLLKRNRERFDSKTVWRNTCEILCIRRFWLFFAAMFFAGGGEYCLTFWVTTYIKLEYPAATMFIGGLGTAVYAGGMIVGRMLSGLLCASGEFARNLFYGLRFLLLSLASCFRLAVHLCGFLRFFFFLASVQGLSGRVSRVLPPRG